MMMKTGKINHNDVSIWTDVKDVDLVRIEDGDGTVCCWIMTSLSTSPDHTDHLDKQLAHGPAARSFQYLRQ